MSVTEVIEHANLVLPGSPVSGDGPDDRWQAIIDVGAFVETDPEPVWEFVRCWGAHEDADLRMAIATCLLEHLLQYHFARIFPRVEELARANPVFADTVSLCWRSGEAELPANASRLDGLLAELFGPAA